MGLLNSIKRLFGIRKDVYYNVKGDTGQSAKTSLYSFGTQLNYRLPLTAGDIVRSA
jgi:hypothetical protein